MNIHFEDHNQDFIGRNEELLYLYEKYNESKAGTTNFIVVEADTGVGKTRLIQEFYHLLSIEEDQQHYWPDNLEDTKHTMTIVPEFQSLLSEKLKDLPWLWIALRCHNKDERNSNYENTTLSQIRRQVRLHIGAIIENKRRNLQNINALKGSLTLLANYAFPGAGSMVELVGDVVGAIDKSVGTYDSVKNLFTFWKNKGQGTADRQHLIVNQEYDSLVNQTLDTFSAIFNRRASDNLVPLILVLDDAQWADPLTLNFLSKLIEKGKEECWPILIVATCWESSLKEQVMKYESNQKNESFGAFYTSLQETYSSQVEKLKLEKLINKQIIEIIHQELPKINKEAKKLLATNCSGDLELLWDFIRRIKNTPGYLNKHGELAISLDRLHFKSHKKKEIARERILEIGNEIACLIAWGSAQGIRFSKAFIDKCSEKLMDEFEINIDQFVKIDNPLNITKNEKHERFHEVAEFRRRLYYEVAREILDDMPQMDIIKSLLLEYYKELYVSGELHTLELVEQMAIMEEFRHLIKEYPGDENSLNDLSKKIGIDLIQVYLTEGLFERCFQIGEDLLKNALQKLSQQELNIVFRVLMEASFGSGNTDKEEKYLHVFTKMDEFESNENPEMLLYQSKFELRCSHTRKAIELAKQAVIHIQDKPMNYLKYRCYEQLIKAYFYAGENIIGMNLIKEVEDQFKHFLTTHEKVKVSFDHNVALFCHNIDLNDQVIKSTMSAKNYYHLLNDKYNHMLSRVNLADALMAVGRLEEAEAEIKTVYQNAKDTNWKHAYNIAAVCYGNILYNQGRLSEALELYEEGIIVSKEINHNWDILYGQIWRQLCLADFGDPGSFDRLEKLKEECSSRGYEYLTSLAACLSVLVAYKHQLPIQLEAFKEYINPNMTPGLYAQFIAVDLLKNDQKEYEKVMQLITLTLQCEGIKGDIEPVVKAIEENRIILEDKEDLLKKFDLWKDRYYHPKKQFEKRMEISMVQRFSSTQTKIKSCGGTCEAMCCYDGVYLNPGEDEMIQGVVEKHPEYFTHLPEDYLVEGNWNDLVSGIKTNTRPHLYSNPHFPKHFENTRCVFAYENGLCSLQTAATELDLHPWKYKPKACWIFPLQVIDGQVCTPPKKGEMDPDYVDETYPGYTTFVPCGQHHASGEIWYKKYKQEIDALDKLLNHKSRS